MGIGGFVAEVKFSDCCLHTLELNGHKKSTLVKMIGKGLVRIKHHWDYHFQISLFWFTMILSLPNQEPSWTTLLIFRIKRNYMEKISKIRLKSLVLWVFLHKYWVKSFNWCSIIKILILKSLNFNNLLNLSFKVFSKIWKVKILFLDIWH